MSAQNEPQGIVALFFVEGGSYPIQFWGAKPATEEAADHAALNPRTLRIEDSAGNILWKRGPVQ